MGVDALACPCGKRMRSVEIVIDRDSLPPLLDGFGYREDPLPIARARALAQTDLDVGP